MTSRGQCPKGGGGGGCECPRVGVFVIFWRADDVTRAMSKGGGLVNVLTPPPPLQEILYPRLSIVDQNNRGLYYVLLGYSHHRTIDPWPLVATHTCIYLVGNAGTSILSPPTGLLAH